MNSIPRHHKLVFCLSAFIPSIALSAPPDLSVAQASTAPPVQAPASSRPAGSFEVDPDAAQRALERTLTQTGALLLPAKALEITPSFQYVRQEQTSPTLVSVTTGGVTTTSFGQNQIRRDDLALRADVRYGLPSDAQLEVGLPVLRAHSTVRDPLGNETSSSGSGFGDLTVGIAKTFLREKGAVPDLIGRLTLNGGTGKTFSGALNSISGYRQIQAEAIAVKRQDPLAFVGGLSYSKVFEKDGVQPGDAIALSVAAILAASPATSLQIGFTQVHRDKLQQAGVTVSGSEQNYGVFSFGASSVLSRDVSLITSFGIGAGGDAPKYSINIALPILFR